MYVITKLVIPLDRMDCVYKHQSLISAVAWISMPISKQDRTYVILIKALKLWLLLRGFNTSCGRVTEALNSAVLYWYDVAECCITDPSTEACRLILYSADRWLNAAVKFRCS